MSHSWVRSQVRSLLGNPSVTAQRTKMAFWVHIRGQISLVVRGTIWKQNKPWICIARTDWRGIVTEGKAALVSFLKHPTAL